MAGAWRGFEGVPAALGQLGVQAGHIASTFADFYDPSSVGDGTPESFQQSRDQSDAGFRKSQAAVADYFRPDASTTGWAGQTLYGVADVGTRFAVGTLAGGPLTGAAVAGSSVADSRQQELLAQGVDPDAAAKAAAIEGGMVAVGSLVPGAVGGSLFRRISSGAGVNVALGMGQRAAEGKVLEGHAPQEVTDQFKTFGAGEIAADAVLGAAFGGISHAHALYAARRSRGAGAGAEDGGTGSVAVEAGQADTTQAGAPDASSPTNDINPAAADAPGDVAVPDAGSTADTAEAVGQWEPVPGDDGKPRLRWQPSHDEIDAALNQMNTRSHTVDSLPGLPDDIASLNRHAAAMDQSLADVLSDRPVSVDAASSGVRYRPLPEGPTAHDIIAKAFEDEGYGDAYREAIEAQGRADDLDTSGAEVPANEPIALASPDEIGAIDADALQQRAGEVEVSDAPATNGGDPSVDAVDQAFRRGAPAAGHTSDSLRESLSQTPLAKQFKDLEDAGVLKLVDHEGDTPIGTSRGEFAGYYDRKSGTAYLNAGKIAKGSEVGVALHELGGHGSLRQMLGDDRFSQITDRLRGLLDQGDRDVAMARLRVPGDTPRGVRDEEWVAHLIEDVANRGDSDVPTGLRGIVQQAMEAIRAWYYATPFYQSLADRGLGIDLTPRDIAALARASVKRLATDAARAPGFRSDMDIATPDGMVPAGVEFARADEAAQRAQEDAPAHEAAIDCYLRNGA